MKTATFEFLKIKLAEDGLYFRGSIPDDGNSFFKACSDQLQRLEIHICMHLCMCLYMCAALCKNN
jgi:hypothetical protein